jgi:MFS family permease
MLCYTSKIVSCIDLPLMSAISPEKLKSVEEPLTLPASHVVEEDSDAAPRIENPVKVVIASSFVLRLAGGSTAIMLSAYLKQDVGAAIGMIGLLYSLFYITEFTLAPVFGAISDLRGRRLILVLGPLIGAFALLLYPISAIASLGAISVWLLSFARLLEGVATAAKVPSALGYLADATSGESKRQAILRGRVMGLYESAFLVGMVGGNLLGSKLWELLSVSGFYIVALIYLVATAMLFFWVPETLPVEAKEHHNQSKQAVGDAAHPVRELLKTRLRAYASLLKEPVLRSFVPAWLAINAVVGVMGSLVQPTLIKAKEGTVDVFPNQLLDGKFTTSHAAFAFVGIGVVFMLGIFAWSQVYARIRKTTVMLIAVGGLGLAVASLYAINNQLLNAWAMVPLLAVGIFLMSGFTPVALGYLAEISGTRVEHRGAVMGLYSVFLGLGQFIGSSGGGLFVQWAGNGFNSLILTVLLLGIVATIAVIWLRAKHAV